MSLQPGTRLGPYEIQSPLGAGGMGEVYKARDTRLDRTVAIKVLPEHVASNPDLKQRFEREARTVAALNHPHICTLHDIGQQDGTDFLVMEYLEGETLTQRLTKGALPLHQALRYAVEIADALDKAHRKGITHRDLKPGNIMVTKAGTKLLDFGLAKLKQPGAAAPGLSALPTQSAGLTKEGTILGTLQYMAPEQLEGKDADARTDMFAFGATVYEMVTGKTAFEGKSQASLIAAILEREPAPISSLQPMSPPALDRVIKKCLEKDPEDRWHTAHDLHGELTWVAESGSQAGVAVSAAIPRRGQSRLAWGVAAVVTVLLAIALVVPYLNRVPAETTTARLSVFTEGGRVDGLALSPDGRQLAFTDGSQLWVRPLDSLESRALPGTEGARRPFWSPDGRSIGFFTVTELKTIDLTGGRPQTVCAVQAGWGGTWNDDGVIVFGRFGGSLLRVPAAGGEPTPVTTLDKARQEAAHLWPRFLPAGDHFLFLAMGALEPQGIYVSSLQEEATPSLLLKANRVAQYAAPGYLLFGQGERLMVQPFDVERLALTGDPVRVVDGVRSNPDTMWLGFSASYQGGLAYVGGAGGGVTQLRWLDRSGADLGTVGEPGEYRNPVLSPDETRVAVDRDGDVRILDLSRGTEQRFTFDPARDGAAVWSPDGSRIVFTSFREGRSGDLYEKAAAGTGEAQLLLESESGKLPFDWSPDSESVSYTTSHPETSADLWFLPMSGDHQPTRFLQTPFFDSAGVFSPDGRWMAYNADDSGELQVYVQRVPPSGGKWQVSTTGGVFPRWRGDGRELYYVSLTNDLMAVDVKAEGDTLEVGSPQRLFPLASDPTFAQRNPFDVTADGQRFLVNALVEDSTSTPITWVLNWTADLEP